MPNASPKGSARQARWPAGRVLFGGFLERLAAAREKPEGFVL